MLEIKETVVQTSQSQWHISHNEEIKTVLIMYNFPLYLV